MAWYRAAPLRVIDPDSPDNGAVRHGIDRRSGRPMDLYTEITGYAVSLDVFLAGVCAMKDRLPSAKDAAAFLLRIQSDGAAYPQPPGMLYTFDTSMCVVGLTRLARAAGDERYLRSAVAAGEWLMTMQRSDGSFRAMIASDGSPRDPGGFFGDGSCIHAKNAIALLELASLTGRGDFRDAAGRVSDHVLGLQEHDGSFRCRPDERHVFTHAHGYACEGLLFAGALLGERRYTASAERGIAWLARCQGSDGGWKARHRASLRTARSLLDALHGARPTDAAAQAVRLFRLAGDAFDQARAKAVTFLTRCQAPDGGFPYGRTRLGVSPYLYTWCTQFALQALAWESHPARVEDLF